jgi:hypothetical protein
MFKCHSAVPISLLNILNTYDMRSNDLFINGKLDTLFACGRKEVGDEVFRKLSIY